MKKMYSSTVSRFQYQLAVLCHCCFLIHAVEYDFRSIYSSGLPPAPTVSQIWRSTKAGWNSNEIPYKFDYTFPSAYKQLVREAMDTIENVTCVRFVPVTTQQNYFTIRSPVRACAGTIGYKPSATLLVDSSCFDGGIGIILHQLMHILGFQHENARPDSNLYIKVRLDRVLPGHAGDFATIKPTDYDTLELPYDYGSIMHLASDAYAANPLNNPTTIETLQPLPTGVVMGQRDGLSELDVLRIKRLYGCA